MIVLKGIDNKRIALRLSDILSLTEEEGTIDGNYRTPYVQVSLCNPVGEAFNVGNSLDDILKMMDEEEKHYDQK